MALLKNKKRSFLTMIGIVIGIAAVSTIMSIGRGFERYVMDALNPEEGDLVTVDIAFQSEDPMWMLETNDELFTDRDLQSLERLSGVAEATRIEGNLQYTSLDTRVNGEERYVDITLTEESGRGVSVGRGLQLSDYTRSSRVAVIPHTLAEEMFLIPEESVGKGIRLGDELYTIIGVYEAAIDRTGLFSEFMLDEVEIPAASYNLYHTQGGTASEVRLTVQRGSLPSEVASEAVTYLEEEGSMRAMGSYEHWDMSMMTDGVSQVLNGITLFIASVAGISLFIAGIGVMNMMYISVSERTKEIGIRRALGASQKSIRLQFVLEGVMMTSIGGAFGYLLGLMFSAAAAILLPFSTGVDMVTVLVSLGISSLVGLIFSYAPANAAGKKEIIDII
ncbi:ABC transporter, permease protein [Alkalibacterium sp. AK22]|nr:ABC transporter, permease protein [Alkalibacterium sp. AK22]